MASADPVGDILAGGLQGSAPPPAPSGGGGGDTVGDILRQGAAGPIKSTSVETAAPATATPERSTSGMIGHAASYLASKGNEALAATPDFILGEPGHFANFAYNSFRAGEPTFDKPGPFWEGTPTTNALHAVAPAMSPENAVERVGGELVEGAVGMAGPGGLVRGAEHFAGKEIPALANTLGRASKSDLTIGAAGNTVGQEIANQNLVPIPEKAKPAIASAGAVLTGGAAAGARTAAELIRPQSAELRAGRTLQSGLANPAETQQHLDALNALHESLSPTAENAPSNLAAHFQAIREASAALHEDVVTAAKDKAQTAAAATAPSVDSAEGVGQNLRDPAVEARARAKAVSDKIFDEVEKYGPVQVATPKIADAAASVGSLVKGAKPLEGEEGRIFDEAKGYGDSTPLAEVRALRSSATDEMANAGKGTQTYGRLAQLVKALDGALNDTVKERLASNPQLRENVSNFIGDAYAQEVANGKAAVGSGIVANDAGGAGANARQGPANVAGQAGAGGEAPLGPTNVESGTGVQARPGEKVDFTAKQKSIVDAAKVEAANAKPVYGHDVRDVAAPSQDGTKTYLGRGVPKGVNPNLGYDPAKYLSIHEHVEKNLMQKDGLGYYPAHERATIVEHDALRADGRDPAAYEKEMGRLYKITDHPPAKGYAPRDMFDKGVYTSRELKEIKAAQPVSENAPEAVSKLQEANTGYRQFQETHVRSVPGKITEQQPRGTDFKVSDASVPGKIFHPGDTGGEDVRAYVKAVGAEAAAKPLEDAAAFSFQKAAMRDGVVDPKNAATWLTNHGSALKELPPKVKAKFGSAALAQKAVETASAAQRTAHAEFEKDAFKKVAGLENDQDVVNHISSAMTSRDATAKLGALKQRAQGNPLAEQGLERGTIEAVLGKFSKTGAAETADTFELSKAQIAKFFSLHTQSLEKVLAPEQVGRLRAGLTAMGEIQGAIKPATANKSVLWHVAKKLALVGGAALGAHKLGIPLETIGELGIVGVLGGKEIGGPIMDAIRGHGVNDVKQILAEAALNPKRSAGLLRQASNNPEKDVKYMLQRLMGPVLLSGVQAGDRQMHH